MAESNCLGYWIVAASNVVTLVNRLRPHGIRALIGLYAAGELTLEGVPSDAQRYVEQMARYGLAELAGNRVKLTEKGRRLAEALLNAANRPWATCPASPRA